MMQVDKVNKLVVYIVYDHPAIVHMHAPSNRHHGRTRVPPGEFSLVSFLLSLA